MMDLNIVNTVIGALMVSLGWLGKQFWEMFKQVRGRRKTELQKISAERDRALAKAQRYYNRKQRVKDILWETRRVARKHGIPDDELPPVPEDDPLEGEHRHG